MNLARQLKVKDIQEIFPEIAIRYNFIRSEPIGERSGFGAVWRVEDTWLGRDVAIKISHSDLQNEVMFCRDIDGHTVRIYDYYVAGEWQAYSMELLSGDWITLSKYISKCELKRRDAQHYFNCFEIMRAILSGLADIHGLPYRRENRVVHSDIKPDNLFIFNKFKKNEYSVFRMPSNKRLVKFIDLGMSISRGESIKGGTRAYQYPDIADFSHTGHDLYSLSITFLELLTGCLADHSDMEHKARISKYISEHSSGSRFIDSIALDVVTKCARAARNPNANVRRIITHMDEAIFSISPLYLVLLSHLTKNAPEGLSKSDMAEYLFEFLAPYYGWKNKTVARVEQIKWLVSDMREKKILFKKHGANLYCV